MLRYYVAATMLLYLRLFFIDADAVFAADVLRRHAIRVSVSPLPCYAMRHISSDATAMAITLFARYAICRLHARCCLCCRHADAAILPHVVDIRHVFER